MLVQWILTDLKGLKEHWQYPNIVSALFISVLALCNTLYLHVQFVHMIQYKKNIFHAYTLYLPCMYFTLAVLTLCLASHQMV